MNYKRWFRVYKVLPDMAFLKSPNAVFKCNFGVFAQLNLATLLSPDNPISWRKLVWFRPLLCFRSCLLFFKRLKSTRINFSTFVPKSKEVFFSFEKARGQYLPFFGTHFVHSAVCFHFNIYPRIWGGPIFSMIKCFSDHNGVRWRRFNESS